MGASGMDAPHIFGALRQHAVGRRPARYARRRALRRIGATLVNLVLGERSREIGERRKQERARQRREARRRVRRILWGICTSEEQREQARQMRMPEDVRTGAVEKWTDAVHIEMESEEPCAMTTELMTRLTHAMRCMVVYVQVVMRHTIREQRREAERKEKKRKALWNICAALVREYKQGKQVQALKDRRKQRLGRVCANTRNIGRLGPKGGVRYDETRRNRQRIQVEDVYTLKRWPRRDKDGPTLVRTLHYLWGIT